MTGSYVIGGDGGRSIVRRAFGFEMIGKTAISQNVQILFESKDLYKALNLEPAMQYWCLNDQFPGFVQTTSPDGEFILSLHKLQDVNSFTLDDAERAVRIAIGADVPFRIIGLDPWVIHARIADSYRRGRAFVVGDAARQHSTYGAHGMKSASAMPPTLAGNSPPSFKGGPRMPCWIPSPWNAAPSVSGAGTGHASFSKSARTSLFPESRIGAGRRCRPQGAQRSDPEGKEPHSSATSARSSGTATPAHPWSSRRNHRPRMDSQHLHALRGPRKPGPARLVG